LQVPQEPPLMGKPLTDVDKLRRLPWLYAGNVWNQIFCILTVFGSVFILFLNELGLEKTQIGFLLALIPFAAIIAVISTPLSARLGFKRTFVWFFAARKIVAGLLMLVPLVLLHFGRESAFVWVAVTVLGFAVARAIAESAFIPWQQEAVPNNIRGKLGAINTILSTVAAIVTLIVASHVVGHFDSLYRFVVLIGVGVVAGLVSTWCFSFVPGGEPPDGTVQTRHFGTMLDSLRDRNFRLFLVGLALVIFGFNPLAAFVPLYMKEQIGLATGKVVLLDVGAYAGIMVSSYLWGWASDRYGSKPVMLSGLGVMLLLPVIWFLLPRQSPASAALAMGAALVVGVATMGWQIGYGRYLYVSAVPAEHKTGYMAVFYAWAGLTAGIAPLLAGRFLDFCGGISSKVSVFTVDQYTPLFAACFSMLTCGVIVMSRVRGDGAMPTGRFVGMFLQGHPVMAIGTMVRYHLARDEGERVSTTERMGQARNPLSINELIEALHDPSFNVRYEAIISVARMPARPELVDELLLVLGGKEPDLAIAAAWALGRIGDKSAVLPLRETLLSDYSLLRARSARALATLGDVESIPFLLREFRCETDDGVRLAYASALGILRASEATDDLIAFLRSRQDSVSREEVALALGRIVGSERRYISLWRSLRSEPGTSAAQALLDIKKSFETGCGRDDRLVAAFDECAQWFARNDLETGARRLSMTVRELLADARDDALDAIIQECGEQLARGGGARMEYVLLALHAAAARPRSPRVKAKCPDKPLPGTEQQFSR